VLADKVNRVGLVQMEHVVQQLRRVLKLVVAEFARRHLTTNNIIKISF
jgi:hypothetical protein